MGNEIKKDTCPEKYYAKSNVITESLPVIIALIIVAFFSGNMFKESGMNTIVTILIECVFVVLLTGLYMLLTKGMKQRLAETHISVCENGVCGICPLNGYKNKSFALSYNEISKVTVKRERLFLYSQKGNVILTLNDAAATAALIQNKMQTPV